MLTKNKTIILNLLDNGSRYITYICNKDRFMLNKEEGSIIYPELSNFNVTELSDIGKHLGSLWQTNKREFPMFIELNLN
jgi:hypothetical protein